MTEPFYLEETEDMNQKRPCPNEDHLSRCWTQRGGGAAWVGSWSDPAFSRVVLASSSPTTAAHMKVKDRPSPHKDMEVGLFSRTLRGPGLQTHRPVHQLQMLAALLPGWHSIQGLNPEPAYTGAPKHVSSLDGCELKLGEGTVPPPPLWCCGGPTPFFNHIRYLCGLCKHLPFN